MGIREKNYEIMVKHSYYIKRHRKGKASGAVIQSSLRDMAQKLFYKDNYVLINQSKDNENEVQMRQELGI